MVALAMAFAAFWGVLQLAVLGWGTRTLRLGTLVLVMGAGCYGAGVAAAAVELLWTRLVAAVTGASVADAVRTAGYTVDPFVEELAKLLPLLVAVVHLRTRRQWGLTDYLLMGAAAGAGFALLEALVRYGHQPLYADPLVPGALAALTSWLPAPVDAEAVAAPGLGGPADLHLAWSAIAGFGVGVWFRVRGHARWAGPALVVLAGAAHAAYNYDVAVADGSTAGEVLSAPFRFGQPALWVWPAVALAVAVVLDVRALRAARAVAPSLRLRRERTGGGGLGGLARYALLGLPWTAFLGLRFVALRRAALYAVDSGGTDDARPVLGEVTDVRTRMDVADHGGAWRGVGLRRLTLGAPDGDPDDPDGADADADRSPLAVLERFWPLLVWAVLLLPAALWFLVGTTPGAEGLQDRLEQPAVFGAVFVIPGGFGLVLLAWHVVTGAHALPALLRQASGELPALVELRVATGLGASLLGVLGIAAWLTGTNPARPLVAAFHLLDALDSLLLVSALALMLAAFVFFPPAVTLGVVARDRGPAALVPVVTLTGAPPALLGLAGVMLAQAVANSGGAVALPVAGAGSVPDIPRRPAPPEPPVHHWRLRRIVDDLWVGTTNPGRVGDGTTMDAVRNEVLTGRPTHGRFHLDKARHAVDRLTTWLDEYGSGASRVDRSWAWALRRRLRRALDGVPEGSPGAPEPVEEFVQRLVVALPALRRECDQIYRECGEDGLTHAAAEVFLDEQTRALRYRFRDGVIEARAELEALAAAIEAEYGLDPDVDDVVDACFVALLSAEVDGPDPLDVLGPKLSAAVTERRAWRSSPPAVALVGRATEAAPAVERLAAENRFGDHGDVLLHGFLGDVAAREIENHRSGGPVAQAEVRTVLALLEAELGADRAVDEAIAVSFVENLPYPGDPGADLVGELGPKLRTELEVQRPPEA
jgi:hypothetical protein